LSQQTLPAIAVLGLEFIQCSLTLAAAFRCAQCFIKGGWTTLRATLVYYGHGVGNGQFVSCLPGTYAVIQIVFTKLAERFVKVANAVNKCAFKIDTRKP